MSDIHNSTASTTTATTTKPKKKNNLLSILIGSILIIVIVLGGLGWWITTTPQYSFAQALEGIQKNDYDKFSKYVDLGAVVDDILQQAKDKSKAEGKTTDTTAETLNNAFSTLISTYIQSIAKKCIESGEVAKALGSQFELSDSNFAAIALLGQKTEYNGDNAKLTLQSKEKKEVVFKMKKKNGYWQVNGVQGENLSSTSNSSSSSNSNNSNSSSSSSQSNNYFASCIGNFGNTGSSSSQNSSEVKTASLEENASINDFGFKILSIKRTDTPNTKEAYSTEKLSATETWLKLSLQVSNQSNQVRYFSSGYKDIYLKDETGQKYDLNTNYSSSLTSQLAPNDFITGDLYFKIPKNNDNLKLYLPAATSMGKPDTMIFDLAKAGDYTVSTLPSLDLDKIQTNKVGETYKGKAINVTLNKVDWDYQPENKYSKPEDGYRFVVLDVTVENLANKSVYADTSSFLKDISGRKIENKYGVISSGNLSGEILTKDKLRGKLSFEVPVENTQLLFYYSSYGNLINSSDTDTIVFSFRK